MFHLMLTCVIFSVTFCNIPIDKDYKVVYNRAMKERCQGGYPPMTSLVFFLKGIGSDDPDTEISKKYISIY